MHLATLLTLSPCLPSSLHQAPLVVNYDQHHTDLDVHFSIDIVPDKFNEVVAAGLEAKFKLTSRFSTGES
jgi:DNA topoisomerase-2